MRGGVSHPGDVNASLCSMYSHLAFFRVIYLGIAPLHIYFYICSQLPRYIIQVSAMLIKITRQNRCFSRPEAAQE